MYTRTLKQTIEKVSKTFPVLLLTGPRQAGKTTLLELCADEKRTYITISGLVHSQEFMKMAKIFETFFIVLIFKHIY